MTLTFDLETSFKVIAYSYLKVTMWVNYEPDWKKGEQNMRPSHLTLKVGSRSLHIFLLKSSVYLKYQPKMASMNVYMPWKKDFLRCSIWPGPLTYTLYLRSLHTLLPYTLCKFKPERIKGKKYKFQIKISYMSAMTLTLDIQTSLKGNDTSWP